LNTNLNIRLAKFTVEAINYWLIAVLTWVLLFSFVFLSLTGSKPHYIIFIAISILLAIFNFSKNVIGIKALYIIAFIVPSFVFLISHAADKPFVYNLLTYLFIPFIFFSSYFESFEIGRILKIFQIFTVCSFIGILLQIAGINLPFLALEYAWIGEAQTKRYGSLAGGTLNLGFFSAISIIYTWYDRIYNRVKTGGNSWILLISIATLLLSSARRYIVFLAPVILLIYLFDVNKTINKQKLKKTVVYILASIGVIFALLFSIKDSSLYLVRFFATFDFVNDGSNAVRVLKWLEAIDKFMANFWFGAGAGAQGAIGKEIDLDDLDTVTVAESYYLKVLVEGGIFFGLFFFGFMIYQLTRAFKFIRVKQKALASFIIIFFFIDSFTSMSLEYVIGSVIFWICVSKLNRNDSEHST